MKALKPKKEKNYIICKCPLTNLPSGKSIHHEIRIIAWALHHKDTLPFKLKNGLIDFVNLCVSVSSQFNHLGVFLNFTIKENNYHKIVKLNYIMLCALGTISWWEPQVNLSWNNGKLHILKI